MYFRWLLLVIALPLALSSIYRGLSDGWQRPYWIAAALVNTVLALVLLGIGALRSRTARLPQAQIQLKIKTPYFILPSLLLLLGAFLATLPGQYWGEAQTGRIPEQVWWWVVWIPWIEEVAFRLGVGSFLRHHTGRWLGSYGSILVFVLVHTEPKLFDLLTLGVGIPWGVLLLAICCEWLYQLSGKIWPSILFHTAANGTVAIFLHFDARLLKWLGFLYIQSN